MPDLKHVKNKFKFIGCLQEVDSDDANVIPANSEEVKMIDTAWIVSHVLNVKTPIDGRY